ncbi:MAG TPA: hypothetical protein VGE07_29445, partial [Herpetosiphonaceae bacterium]
ADARITYEEAIEKAQKLSDTMQEAGCNWEYGLMLVKNGDRDAGVRKMLMTLTVSREAGLAITPQLEDFARRIQIGDPVTQEMIDLVSF